MNLLYVCRCEGISGLFGQCRQHYASDDGFFNETINGPIRTALENISRIFNARGEQKCVDLILQYLCYYYFPVCDLSTGEVTTSCVSTCNLIVNNQDCSNLLEEARDIFNQIDRNIPTPNYNCLMTYVTRTEPTDISNECIEIEG